MISSRASRRTLTLAALLVVAGCKAEPTPAPAPAQPDAEATPEIATAPPPPASSVAGALPTPELDNVGTALGRWVLRDGSAMFGPPDAPAYFILSCDRDARRVKMARTDRRGDVSRIQIVTPSAAATMSATVEPGPPRMVTGSLSADDVFFGALLATDDRFGVRIDQDRTLAMTMASEVRTVIEGCRRPV
ncbi:hypothetical protein OKW76_13905 [Sphingomonas sp. S1-29]|uniref:hypothetical protein n=1 Tax=Sphingomonas sp. S1-29 TaxID=2991074 RepID=UPI00223EF24E|nr:hypothetical protein [Sphingomonas sp. S1-29]UZK69104.1 hypothetical protein OKW76_13905 [Sphingomonas sp. S1-29]